MFMVFCQTLNNMKKSIFIAALGTLIEYYDYAIFSMFLPFLAPTFFPANSAYDALIMGFYAVLIASIARPLGGIVFGAIGDRFGRRRALLISLYGIAAATLLIGFLPGFKSIGMTAMVILTLVRAVQMLCYGGEYSGAGIYVVELAKARYMSLVGAVLTAMALLGSVVASLVGMFLTWHNPASPNWRLAFILGGVVGLIAIYFRQGMTESVNHEDLAKRESLGKIIVTYPKQLFAGVCIGGFSTLPFTTVLSFINPVLKTKGYFSGFAFMSLQFALSSIAVIILISSGLIADRVTPAKVMRYASIALLILSIPLGFMLQSYSLWLIICAEVILVVLNELLLGPSNAYLKQLFPANCRYRGVAFSFCLGMSLVGGLTPLVENCLYKNSGYMASISVWLILISGLTWFSLHNIEKQSLKREST